MHRKILTLTSIVQKGVAKTLILQVKSNKLEWLYHKEFFFF